MENTVKLISQIDSATKPLACDCFDLRGGTWSRCPVCDGKGGMKSCFTCGGAGMSPYILRQCKCVPIARDMAICIKSSACQGAR